MSAVPKKKLCWNCEGNVSREMDNCPYCAVYLHASDLEEESNWNPSYRPSTEPEEIPSPVYQIHSHIEDTEKALTNNDHDEMPTFMDSIRGILAVAQFKKDVFSILFLMAGSIFFLFGIVLLLFSQNGTLTLQWQSEYSYYFLILAIPLVILGWKFLQESEPSE